MTTVKAALLFEQPGEWKLADVRLDEPREHEVLVRYLASGLCHSDDHICVGDIPVPHLPLCGGHEGAAIVEAVGPGVTRVAVGDHIATAFIPACGQCRWCAAGSANLCNLGANFLTGEQFDGSYRMHLADTGEPVAQLALTATFAERSVIPEYSCVKIDDSVPPAVAAVISCAGVTGWGAAANGLQVAPGDVVIVVGLGGIGLFAVQGARIAGARQIIGVDPVELKRDAACTLGATHATASIEEAAEIARSATQGQGADGAIVAVGVTNGTHLAQAFAAIRKGGTLVAVGAGRVDEMNLPVSLFDLTMSQKRVQGVLFGMGSPNRDIPRLLDLYTSGQLYVDEMLSARYALDEINRGYADMHAGKNLRGVITYS